MPDRLSIHAPTLVNTVGHAAGAIIFGILLYLLFIDWHRNRRRAALLPSLAAGLALLWNIGSMVGLATDPHSGFLPQLVIALSFSVLSFLPAVLLHISAGKARWLIVSGYVLSAAASVLHIADLLTGVARYHYAAILLITIGFSILTIALIVAQQLTGERDHGSRRLAGAMVLFIFAVSFAHFGSAHGGRAWSGEIALHHAGIPLALFVLLQDYRFLLLDTFIRFLVNAVLAAAAIAVLVFFGTRFDPLREANAQPFYTGLAFVAGCVFLIVFGSVRRRVQAFVTRAIFLRSNFDKIAAEIQELATAGPDGERRLDENAFLNQAAARIAAFVRCDHYEWRTEPSEGVPEWVRLALPVTFTRGDRRSLLLGERQGGRLFLSEDLAALENLLLQVGRHVDRLRAAEMQSLLVESEFKALQAQINPHFLFNTLNTIYGSIPRASHNARTLILNLSDILRYSLASDRTFIRLEDELRIIREYLEIEQMRLGPRLQTEIDIDERAFDVEIPAFSIQPLVENAVKHGVAARTAPGYVKLAVTFHADRVGISVENSGPFIATPGRAGTGHGLALGNVRRRLVICYGVGSDLLIDSDTERTHIHFEVPVPALASV
jgi:hypothetical protein